MKRAIIILTFTVIPLFSASAQRTSLESNLITVSGCYTFNRAGASVNYGRYQNLGYWDVAITGANRDYLFTCGDKLRNIRFDLSGEYMFRIFGTRSRAFNIYAGPGAFIGVDFNKDFRTFYGGNKSEYPEYNFIYGLYPRAELEGFISQVVALTLYGRVPICFGA